MVRRGINVGRGAHKCTCQDVHAHTYFNTAPSTPQYLAAIRKWAKESRRAIDCDWSCRDGGAGVIIATTIAAIITPIATIALIATRVGAQDRSIGCAWHQGTGLWVHGTQRPGTVWYQKARRAQRSAHLLPAGRPE